MSATALTRTGNAGTRTAGTGTSVQSRIETVSRRRAKARTMAVTIQGLWIFAIVFFFSHLAISITGHMLAEGERVKIKSLTASLAVARNNERALKAEAIQENSLAAVDAWAKEHGFIDAVQSSPVYVATR